MFLRSYFDKSLETLESPQRSWSATGEWTGAEQTGCTERRDRVLVNDKLLQYTPNQSNDPSELRFRRVRVYPTYQVLE